MRSVIISSALLIILIVAISANAYYVNSLSTEMLDMTFALPSEFEYISSLDETEIEKYKTEINKLVAKWEKHAVRINLVSKYSDFDRVNSNIYSMKEYFFTGFYTDYAAARKRLIAALEKQKQNELPVLENVF
jgi:hypothetical protein